MLSVASQVFVTEFIRSLAIQVFVAEFVLTLAKQLFAAKVCVSSESVSLLNCVDYNKLGVRCQIVLVTTNNVFAAKFMWSVRNKVFAMDLHCRQQIKCSLRTCVVGSELGVHYRFALSTAVNRSESGVRC